MSKGAIFWMLMILWAIFGLVGHFNPTWVYLEAGGDLLLFILLALLGWKTFGPAVQ